MEDMLIMSKKELERKTLLDGYKFGKLSLLEVSERLDIGYRQTKRIWSSYQNDGDIGLCHKNRGRKPGITYPQEFKDVVLRLYQSKYCGFGPTYAAEKLLEDDGLTINNETLRLWLKEAGLWQKTRKRHIYRKKRERRAGFGELLQIDGSIHKWFEGKDEHYCLLNIVDDATGTTLARLAKGETTRVLMETFLWWIKKYGIPKAVYVDLKSVYVSSKSSKNINENNPNGYSLFQRICNKLGIEVIRAYSPQAKGRVERKHRVFQDRLVKDIKLYHLNTIDEVNTHLESKFLDNINQKFALDIDEITDVHRDPLPYGDLNEIFCWSYSVCVRNDWSVKLKGKYYQIDKKASELVKPRSKILIKEYLDKKMIFWNENKVINYSALVIKPERKPKKYQPKGPCDPKLLSERATENRHKSSWGDYNHLYFVKKVKKAS